ncbi:hypothetical protein J45TS6_36260 [Paenibacillus sp. J45TS6]|nr:hypothetical protein J45TS6_36260 [Paenibacillus sp. J45TS6]
MNLGITYMNKSRCSWLLGGTWQLNEKRVKRVVWHFFRSTITGKIGGSKPLLKYLRENKIKIQYHYYF